MTRLIYRTKGGSPPDNKPRIYFSCHPDDFEKTFETVCEDIFKTHDCVIFYKEDMADSLPEETREVDLGRMNLFVFPVTFKMLKGGNLASDEDLVYAKRVFKPILPIMFEYKIDSMLPFYTKPEMFGDRHFLNKFSHDFTEKSFEEKLNKYLDCTLINDDIVGKIRKAFDAYIFLSYRKKDRKFANELMQLIHNDPVCRNIAIWFDEFLTPGESFNTSIEKALNDSKLVTLLVTPSLLEIPNYVQEVEYPFAVQFGKTVFPAEKVVTDKEKLNEKYQMLPEVVNVNDEVAFKRAFLESIKDVVKHETDHDPMHNYLIGLAYLVGIDVETNSAYGVELITKAAESDFPEAMKKLGILYHDGKYVSQNKEKEIYWIEKLYKYHTQKYGEEAVETLNVLFELATAYYLYFYKEKAYELHEKCYETRCRILGENHPDTLNSLNSLACCYSLLDNEEKALELFEKCYERRCIALGETHPDTIVSLYEIAGSYSIIGKDEIESIELYEKCYTLRCKILGSTHPDTMEALHMLAVHYDCDDFNLESAQKALELFEKCYEQRLKHLGEESPDTLMSLFFLSCSYERNGEYEKALELNKRDYKINLKLNGEEHPNTIDALHRLGSIYLELEEFEKAARLLEKSYKLSCSIWGETHIVTLDNLYALAQSYSGLQKYKEAAEMFENCYKKRCAVLGDEDIDTINSLLGLALSYENLEEFEEALELFNQCYEIQCELFGEDDPYTLETLDNIEYINDILESLN